MTEGLRTLGISDRTPTDCGCARTLCEGFAAQSRGRVAEGLCTGTGIIAAQSNSIDAVGDRVVTDGDRCNALCLSIVALRDCEVRSCLRGFTNCQRTNAIGESEVTEGMCALGIGDRAPADCGCARALRESFAADCGGRVADSSSARAAVVAAGAPVVAAQRRAEPPENPDLLKMEGTVQAAERRYKAACAAWFAAWNEWSPQWPAAPESCIAMNVRQYCRDTERDLSGAPIKRPGQRQPFEIVNEYELRAEIRTASDMLVKDAKRKRSKGKAHVARWQEHKARAERALVDRQAYVAECMRVKEASDFPAIEEERTEAGKDLYRVVREALAIPNEGRRGLEVKCSAAAALYHMHPHDAFRSEIHDKARAGYTPPLVGSLAVAMKLYLEAEA